MSIINFDSPSYQSGYSTGTGLYTVPCTDTFQFHTWRICELKKNGYENDRISKYHSKDLNNDELSKLYCKIRSEKLKYHDHYYKIELMNRKYSKRVRKEITEYRVIGIIRLQHCIDEVDDHNMLFMHNMRETIDQIKDRSQFISTYYNDNHDKFTEQLLSTYDNSNDNGDEWIKQYHRLMNRFIKYHLGYKAYSIFEERNIVSSIQNYTLLPRQTCCNILEYIID